MRKKFRVGVTRDLRIQDHTSQERDVGLDLLDKHSHVEWEFMSKSSNEITSEQISKYDAIINGGNKVTAQSLENSKQLTLMALFGAGFDYVDIQACTKNAILVSTTPDGVRRPVASSFMALILALSHGMMHKDNLIRAGRWNERHIDIGVGLVGKVLGLVGMGSIGSEVFRLAKPFGMRHVTYDPYVSSEQAEDVGAELVDLKTLMQISDFVCISCPLNEETYHLINEERLLMMKESAYFINVARGKIVDQKALTSVLEKKLIQGAGIDVFEQEPIDPNDPILSLDNVILSPHTLCMTDQCYRGIGESAVRSILEVADGKIPQHLIVNKEVLQNPDLTNKLNNYSTLKNN